MKKIFFLIFTLSTKIIISNPDNETKNRLINAIESHNLGLTIDIISANNAHLLISNLEKEEKNIILKNILNIIDLKKIEYEKIKEDFLKKSSIPISKILVRPLFFCMCPEKQIEICGETLIWKTILQMFLLPKANL